LFISCNLPAEPNTVLVPVVSSSSVAVPDIPGIVPRPLLPGLAYVPVHGMLLSDTLFILPYPIFAGGKTPIIRAFVFYRFVTPFGVHFLTDEN